MKRAAFVFVVLVLASTSFLSCGGYSKSGYKPPSGLTTRALASQNVSSPTAFPGLVLINGKNDTLPRISELGAGSSPGLLVVSPDRTILLAFDSGSNSVQVVNAKTETRAGSIQLAGATTSMVTLSTNVGYAAVPSALRNGSSPGAIQVMNLTAGGITANISVPNAQTVIASPDGTQLLVFSGDSDTVTIIAPLLVNTGNNPVTAILSGFDRPVYGIISPDGGTAYILNCGPECGSGSASASIQMLDLATLAIGPPLAVDAATTGWINGSTLYVAGTPTASVSNSTPNNLCTGTAAPTCGRLDIVDVGSMTVTGSAVITDGYHNRIDMSSNGQLFIGSYGCSTVGNVNDPQGEVRGCLSIFNTSDGMVTIPPDNGDVTGLQSFSTRAIEYVAEGGNLRVYDTTRNKLQINAETPTGTFLLNGKIVDVKAIDFF